MRKMPTKKWCDRITRCREGRVGWRRSSFRKTVFSISCILLSPHFFVSSSRSRFVVLLFMVFAAGPQLLRGQFAENPATSEREVRLQRMRNVVDGLEAYSVSDGVRKPVARVPDPILRFSDAAREHEDGTLWTWGRTGRPILIMELYKDIGAEFWAMAMSSLSAGPVRLQARSGWTWQSERPGLVFQAFASAPAPTAKDASRLRQMKELAGRFTAHQFWDPNNQRSELRLLPHPAHRYQNSAAGLVDGTLFLFCHSTNAELILVIEAARQEDAGPVWRFALARLGHAEFHASLDGREIWQAARVQVPAANDPYYLVLEPIQRTDAP